MQEQHLKTTSDMLFLKKKKNIVLDCNTCNDILINLTFAFLSFAMKLILRFVFKYFKLNASQWC